MTKHKSKNVPPMLAQGPATKQPFNVTPQPASRKARTAKQARQRENQLARIAVQSARGK
jgi:hypothetical protein